MIELVREDWEESFLVDWWKPKKVEYTYIASVGERLDHEQHLKGSVDGDGNKNKLPMNES